MKALQFLTIILLALACKKEKTSTFDFFPIIEASQLPIWINQECPTKEILVKVTTDSPDNVNFEVDGKALTPVIQKSTGDQYYKLELPTNQRLNSLNIKLVKGENAPEQLQIPINYFSQKDTLNYYSANIENYGLRPIHNFLRECWGSYVGGIFHKNKDYFIGYDLSREDKVIGDTLKRSFKLTIVRESFGH